MSYKHRCTVEARKALSDMDRETNHPMPHEYDILRDVIEERDALYQATEKDFSKKELEAFRVFLKKIKAKAEAEVK